MFKLIIGVHVFTCVLSVSYLIGWCSGTAKRFLREHPHIDRKQFKTENPLGILLKLLLLAIVPIFNVYFCWWLDKNNDAVYKEMVGKLLEYYELKLFEQKLKESLKV